MKTINNTVRLMKSVRKTWGEMNPVARVVPSKKAYSRKNKFQSYKLD